MLITHSYFTPLDDKIIPLLNLNYILFDFGLRVIIPPGKTNCTPLEPMNSTSNINNKVYKYFCSKNILRLKIHKSDIYISEGDKAADLSNSTQSLPRFNILDMIFYRKLLYRIIISLSVI